MSQRLSRRGKDLISAKRGLSWAQTLASRIEHLLTGKAIAAALELIPLLQAASIKP